MTRHEAARAAYMIGARYRTKRDIERAREIAWDTEVRYMERWTVILRPGARAQFSKIYAIQDHGPLTIDQARIAFMAGALGEDVETMLRGIGESSGEA